MAGAAVMIEVVLLVIGINRRREVSRVARVTKRRGVCKSAGVAGHARDTGMRSGEQKTGHSVIKTARFSRKPGGRRVTLGTQMRKAIGHMVGIHDTAVIIGMTRIAIRRSVVEAAGVTTGAIDIGVSPG